MRVASNVEKRIEELEAQQAAREGKRRTPIVYGIYDTDKRLMRCYERTATGEMILSFGKPQVSVPLQLERMLLTKARSIILYGGRGGAKSITVQGHIGAFVHDTYEKVMCFREIQNSLDQSVFSGLVGEIKRLNLQGFFGVPSRKTIKFDGEDKISFWGLRGNSENLKSLYRYAMFWVEEAANVSQESLDSLGPTLRGTNRGQFIYTFNPKGSNTPIYKNYVAPYLKQIRAQGGVYEDNHILVININYWDNPWFEDDESLKADLAKNKKEVELGIMSEQKFRHIWYGEPDDDVENAIISSEMFDAAIDAHCQRGCKFEPSGLLIASHDPSDTGDAKGFALRQGSVILDCQECNDGDVHYGCDWALGIARANRVDHYTWDCDGLGLALRRQIASAFKGSRTTLAQFKGSEAPDRKEAIYSGDNPYLKRNESERVTNKRTNGDTFKNKRAQYYWELRRRFENTYRAVKLGEPVHPEDMISLSSKIPDLDGLRSEICRIPLKHNSQGKIQIMGKEEMLREGIPSPNRADAIMMCMRLPPIASLGPPPIPRPLKVMGGAVRR